ncbi:MAG: hypothetical protein R3C19_25975 [Planctomycetaceae bacterium]
MADGKCGSVLDAAQESLVLALQVAEKTLLESPETIQRILNDPKVKTAIEEAATKQAKELIDQQRKGKAVSSEDVRAKAAALGKAVSAPAKTVALQELEKTAKGTAAYRKLEQSLKELECAWKQSPVGIWVDKHKGLLYIVGAGLALESAIVMYHFKAGDEVTEPLLKLTQGLVKFKVLGNVEIAAKEIKFVPSKREVGATMLTTATWEKVKVKFEAGITFQDASVAQASVRGDVEVKVIKGLDFNAHGAYSWNAPSPDAPWQNQHRFDLGLGISYKKAFGVSRLTLQTMMFATQDAETTKYGGKGSLDLKLTEYARPGGYKASVDLNLNVGANEMIKRLPPGSGADQTRSSEFTSGLGITAHF